ncbi:MAG: CPBP family intramembrane glutamic endopeptidase, partial [Planctomycetota bacterium]
ALVTYDALAHSDTSDLRAQLPPGTGAEVLVVGLVVALVNALSEEIAYRGVLQHALESELGVNALTLTLQAFAFAAPHYAHGYPRGVAGVALCTVYGALLGLVRRRSQGLLLTVIAHIAADITIFAIVLRGPPR